MIAILYSFFYIVLLPGKLPGLYGGKKYCAGGDPASDCFSTRIMWRENGMGELYFYGNRDAQDPAICQMPNNYCAPTYGWSLNTGAFNFTAGNWHVIEETLTLNTPGIILFIKSEVLFFIFLSFFQECRTECWPSK
jgi:hypothetical protein